MRSACRLGGVPSTRETGTASLDGGASNRPMRAGFAENSFLVIAVCAPRGPQRLLPRSRTAIGDRCYDAGVLADLHATEDWKK